MCYGNLGGYLWESATNTVVFWIHMILMRIGNQKKFFIADPDPDPDPNPRY